MAFASKFNVPRSTVHKNLNQRLGKATLRVHKGSPPKDVTEDVSKVKEVLYILTSVYFRSDGCNGLGAHNRLEAALCAAGCRNAARPTVPECLGRGGSPEPRMATRLKFAKTALSLGMDRSSLLFVDESFFRVEGDRTRGAFLGSQSPRLGVCGPPVWPLRSPLHPIENEQGRE